MHLDDVYDRAKLEDIIVTWLNRFHKDMVEAGEIAAKKEDYPMPSDKIPRFELVDKEGGGTKFIWKE